MKPTVQVDRVPIPPPDPGRMHVVWYDGGEVPELNKVDRDTQDCLMIFTEEQTLLSAIGKARVSDGEEIELPFFKGRSPEWLKKNKDCVMVMSVPRVDLTCDERKQTMRWYLTHQGFVPTADKTVWNLPTLQAWEPPAAGFKRGLITKDAE